MVCAHQKFCFRRQGNLLSLSIWVTEHQPGFRTYEMEKNPKQSWCHVSFRNYAVVLSNKLTKHNCVLT